MGKVIAKILVTKEFQPNNPWSIMQSYWDLMILLSKLKAIDDSWYQTIDNDKWKIVSLHTKLRIKEE